MNMIINFVGDLQLKRPKDVEKAYKAFKKITKDMLINIEPSYYLWGYLCLVEDEL